MEISEIRDTCIESAETYLNFMENNDKGYEEVDVSDKVNEESSTAIVKLRLSKRLFDIETIAFKDLRNNNIYDTSEIKVVEYDSDTNLLIVRPEQDIRSVFLNLRHQDIKVISDLKFLVKNLKLWYELNGKNIKLPTKISKLKDSSKEIKFLEALSPSETQKESIKNIFENPFSYVWGAPGTGKTQFVLAYSALHYVANDLRIGIFASTNNALEQVLRGVLKMTDKSGIERNKILRLGNPTRKFAEEYPEVCEERGILKAVKETDDQIGIINRVLNYADNAKKINDLDSKLGEIQQLNILKEFKMELQEKLAEKKYELKENVNNITKAKKDMNESENEIAKLNKKKKSIFSKLKKAVSKTDLRIEESITEQIQKSKNLKTELTGFEIKSDELNKQVLEINTQIQNVIDDSKNYITDLSTTLKEIKKFASISKSLNLDNFDKIKTELEEHIKKEKDSLNIDEKIYSEYKELSREQIEKKIKDFEHEKEKLLRSSPDSRLQNVNIVACTLDTYIGRFKDKKLDIDHIFLDEAGYANLIKALTLFANDVPVTYLGDHMQLPPVCEIGDQGIQRKHEYFNMYLWAQSSLYIESLFSRSNDGMRTQYLNNDAPEFTMMKHTSLISTFRFGQNLAEILDAKVYNIGLRSSITDSSTGITVLNGRKTEGNKSRENLNEAIAIKNFIRNLTNNDFIILTPYKKQLKVLGKEMPRERNNLKILTVHGSQGREWDIVILSVVDTSDKWFVDSTNNLSKGLKLLNTALSRARKELIIVCDENYWRNQKGQLISDLINIKLNHN